MSDEEIDLDRVVVDPDYRRLVIDFLNGSYKLNHSAETIPRSDQYVQD